MPNLQNLQQMLTQVRQLQEQLQQQLEKVNVEGSSGGGLVSVRMNGQKQLTEVRIDPELLAGGDREMLQMLLVAAVNSAARQVDDALQQQLSTMAGGLSLMKLPGLFQP